jgi:hypothetical protein
MGRTLDYRVHTTFRDTIRRLVQDALLGAQPLEQDAQQHIGEREKVSGALPETFLVYAEILGRTTHGLGHQSPGSVGEIGCVTDMATLSETAAVTSCPRSGSALPAV